MAAAQIEIPEDVLDSARLTPAEAKRELALALYSQQRLSAGKARPLPVCRYGNSGNCLRPAVFRFISMSLNWPRISRRSFAGSVCTHDIRDPDWSDRWLAMRGSPPFAPLCMMPVFRSPQRCREFRRSWRSRPNGSTGPWLGSSLERNSRLSWRRPTGAPGAASADDPLRRHLTPEPGRARGNRPVPIPRK